MAELRSSPRIADRHTGQQYGSGYQFRREEADQLQLGPWDRIYKPGKRLLSEQMLQDVVNGVVQNGAVIPLMKLMATNPYPNPLPNLLYPGAGGGVAGQFDSRASSTITLVDTDQVSEWVVRDGDDGFSLYAEEITPDVEPTLTENGVELVDGDYLEGIFANLCGANAFALAFMFEITEITGTHTLMHALASDGVDPDVEMFKFGWELVGTRAKLVISGRRDEEDELDSIETGEFLSAGLHVLVMVWDFENANMLVRVDGMEIINEEFGTAGTLACPFDPAFNYMAFGAEYDTPENGYAPINGAQVYAKEVLLSPETWTNEEITDIEEYLVSWWAGHTNYYVSTVAEKVEEASDSDLPVTDGLLGHYDMRQGDLLSFGNDLRLTSFKPVSLSHPSKFTADEFDIAGTAPAYYVDALFPLYEQEGIRGLPGARFNGRESLNLNAWRRFIFGQREGKVLEYEALEAFTIGLWLNFLDVTEGYLLHFEAGTYSSVLSFRIIMQMLGNDLYVVVDGSRGQAKFLVYDEVVEDYAFLDLQDDGTANFVFTDFEAGVGALFLTWDAATTTLQMRWKGDTQVDSSFSDAGYPADGTVGKFQMGWYEYPIHDFFLQPHIVFLSELGIGNLGSRTRVVNTTIPVMYTFPPDYVEHQADSVVFVLGELVFYSRVLSDAEMDDIEAYWESGWPES